MQKESIGGLIWLLSYFISYTLLLGGITVFGFYRNQRRNKKNKGSKITLDEVTAIIPFRNEAKNLPLLLKSLNVQPTFINKIIFVDDHSEDDSVQIIRDSQLKFEYEVITNDGEGKKAAIRSGVKKVETAYILSLDADIELPENYFKTLETLPDEDLILMPAIMNGQGLIQLFELDLHLVNGINAGVAGLCRPIMASGANMLYRKTTFEEVDSYEEHKQYASGDDMFLLKDFRENKKQFRLIVDADLSIQTDAPKTWNAFMMQRLRWLGKTGGLKDQLANGLAVIQLVYTLSFYCLLILGFVFSLECGLLIWGMKSIIDILLYIPFFNRINKRNRLWLFPLYELLFPVYNLILLVMLPFVKPKWKGRKIYT